MAKQLRRGGFGAKMTPKGSPTRSKQHSKRESQIGLENYRFPIHFRRGYYTLSFSSSLTGASDRKTGKTSPAAVCTSRAALNSLAGSSEQLRFSQGRPMQLSKASPAAVWTSKAALNSLWGALSSSDPPRKRPMQLSKASPCCR